MKRYNFSIVIEHDKDGYFASCPELQGCYSQGETYEEALGNIKDAIRLHEEKERMLAITNREYARLIDLRTDGRILNRLGNWANEHDKEKRARGVMRILDYEPIFTAQEALQYGLADHIITPRELRALFYEPT